MENEEAKNRLRDRLNEVHQWPSVYMFKFVLEPDSTKLDELLALFPAESEVLRRYSSTGKYVSITVKEVMLSAEEVVSRHEKASSIPGVIVL